MRTILFSFIATVIHLAPFAYAQAPTVDLDDELETYCENYQESADTLDVKLPKICLAKGN